MTRLLRDTYTKFRLCFFTAASGLFLGGCTRPPPTPGQPDELSGPSAVGDATPERANAAESVEPGGDREPAAAVDPVPTMVEAEQGEREQAEQAELEAAEIEVAIADPNGPKIEHAQALAGFFSALDRVRAKEAGAIARVLHMGDSSVGLDGLPQAIRRRMQTQFGDAGPGFVLVDRFSKNYSSNVAKIEAGGWKICYIAYLCKKDGHYGLGGHTFRDTTEAWTKIGPHRRSLNGREVSKFELWYAATPKGGELKLRVDRGPYEVVDTRAEALEDRWHAVTVEAGEHSFELRGGRGGAVRVYGVAMENEGPGVVWDTVSMTGAYVRRLHGYNDEHIAGQVAHRDPDLLVINYGGNDLRRFAARSVERDVFKEEYRTTVRKLRQGKPEMACLIVGVTDHGRSGPYDVAPKHVEMMTSIEREVATEEGCAFFDSVAAMGGPGSVHAWVKAGKVSPDLKHLSRRGIDVMGSMIYDALIAAYAEGKRRPSGSTGA